MLKKIIYSGIEGRDKFILSDFPDSIKQAQEFEQHCATISAVILAAGTSMNKKNTIDIIDNGLSIDTIDSLLQKEHRLKPMRCWDESTFSEHLGSRTNWAFVMGGPLSGKSLVAKLIAESTKGKVVDMNALAESIRPRLEVDE